jgi:NAD dependent epimerase/dehydratase
MLSYSSGRILVTGADGFIGSHLVETLVEMGCNVTALCIYNSAGTYGWLERFAATSTPNLRLVLGDVRDAFFVDQLVEGHSLVFHLASLIAIPHSYVAPHSYFDTNLMGTLNIAQASLRHKVQRLVHTSTSEVYGSAQFVPITEEHPLRGQSPYSASKISADMLINSYFCSFNLPCTTLRPFNTYGPRQSLRAVIPTIISQILSDNGVVKLGSLSPTRDFNFVLDTVAGFIALMQADAASVLGQTFNCGTGREISIENLALLIGDILEKKVVFESEEARFRPALSEVERLLADSSKMQVATGWLPKVCLEDGLRCTIDWMRRHTNFALASAYHR